MSAPCPNPPTMQIIREQLILVLNDGIAKMNEQDAKGYKSLVTHLEKRPGDKDFMLKVLAHLTWRNHMYF